MNKLILFVAGIVFAASAAFAQSSGPASINKAAAPTVPGCEAKAADKNGKPLAGAAKKSFMKKCEAGDKEGSTSSCAAKAVDKNGKPLAGAAKTSFMKKCVTDTGQ